MAFLQHIRTRIGEYFLLHSKLDFARRRAFMNIDAAKSFGIVYCADKAEDVALVQKYSDLLLNSGKEVKTLGFLNIKEVASTGISMSKSHSSTGQHQFFSHKEINWYLKPSAPFIAHFVKEEFDILLDFNISWQLPITFISSLSAAKCKVGRYSEKYLKLYDVMIETPENPNLEYLVENIYSYMQKLNRKAS